MKYAINFFIKILVITLTLLLLNLTIIPNYQYATATNLTMESLLPEKGYYWKYENRDFEDGWIFHFTLKFDDEKTIMVANKNVEVIILEGTGEIVYWPEDIDPNQRSGDNEIYVKKQIQKSNFETITYTQEISYRYFESGNLIKNYIYSYYTYNITEITKPENITIGSNWTRKVLRTVSLEFKTGNNEPTKITHPEEIINSTFNCDRIIPVEVPAGTFTTYRIVERQWIIDLPDTTIYWYYSTEVKNIVKMERKNIASDNILETEELMEFSTGIPDNNNDENGNNISDNGDQGSWLNLQNRDFQIILGASIILIIGIAIGVFVYRKKRNEN